MRVLLDELLFALSRALDYVEQELLGVTSNHGKRTALLCARICRELGFSEPDVFDMACCAVLHDNALTAHMPRAGGRGDIRKLEHFKSHCAVGERNALAFPFTGNVAGIILHHHENWDGSGFNKLKGDAIPVRAAVLRLADNMDLKLAMGDARPGLADDIRRHVARHKGELYSPVVADALPRILGRDLIRDIADDRIDAVLKNEMPSVRVELSTKQLLRVCEIFAFIIDAKSHFTRNHSGGIADKVRCLAPFFGLEGEDLDKLVIAAYLHDVGKLATPVTILEKPGPLTKEEFAIMREHAAATHDILCEISGMETICHWSSNHHERLDGKGYPMGNGSNSLDLQSRLLACCDIYQALTEDRPYRAGMDHGKAMAIMEAMAGRGEIDAYVVETIRNSADCVMKTPAYCDAL